MNLVSDISLSYLRVLENSVKLTTNNLSNSSSAGFQAKFLPAFEKTSRPGFGKNYSYVQDLATTRDTSKGAFHGTENALDLYLDGEGYFAVQTGLGVLYTRKGTLTRNNVGQLATPEGHLVLDEGFAPIAIPEGAQHIKITKDGAIETEEGIVATIGRFRFNNPKNLLDREDTLLEPLEGEDPVVDNDTQVFQGGYEKSNVNAMHEMTRLMILNRDFQEVSELMNKVSKTNEMTVQKLLKVSGSA